MNFTVRSVIVYMIFMKNLCGMNLSLLFSTTTFFWYSTVNVEGETIDVPLNPAAATDSLDGLAKEIYCRAFDWLVAKINESTSCAKGAMSGTIDLLVREP